MYITGIGVFFLIVIGGPLGYHFFSIPPTCTDGIQNQGETTVDHGGPCLLLDDRTLQPHAVLWARSFLVREGSYNAVAYIENPNEHAGVREAHYRFSFFDSENRLITKRDGIAAVMPGGTTPIFEGRVDAGERVVTRTRFEFTQPLRWERLKNIAASVSVGNIVTQTLDSSPRVSAQVTSRSYTDIGDLSFVAVAFDTVGNAFAVSGTALSRLPAGGNAAISFTWPTAFTLKIGRLDVIPIHIPQPDPLPGQ